MILQVDPEIILAIIIMSRHEKHPAVESALMMMYIHLALLYVVSAQ